jgi:hypothetical protein
MSQAVWMCYKCGELGHKRVCEKCRAGTAEPLPEPTERERISVINNVADILKQVMETDAASTDPKDGGDLIERYELALDRLELFRVAVHKAVDVLVNGAT